MKKSSILIAVFIIASLILGACAPKDTATPVVEVPTEETVVEETAEVVEEPTVEATEETVEEVVTLRIWADDTRTPILLGLAYAFME